jgi:hypothetical protein
VKAGGKKNNPPVGNPVLYMKEKVMGRLELNERTNRRQDQENVALKRAGCWSRKDGKKCKRVAGRDPGIRQLRERSRDKNVCLYSHVRF